ncbi:3-phosphoshikimate 1-carboxyvinyltransferase [Allofrancisella guangzhouensis]|uniref:3-phosphoshikimate 1-carboxyvinyltransferase n=1 Tax=Allofrancisella guangzhouensis TaxID=594679 RepID=A0A0A8E3J9_9GAMM|nr:3-phosphoshikimate 1-carboxyvinyltransferase [Allofrancisella guangzhouensis]AJC48805.1 3-phosphoshikimate 1-carboxyvinyltransferase [Allofrancisella guangzhouensis]MBK2027144.1 3-phosphoshikimate 1-carboxyvinyltransferase [Allofrancisella guangzhouensis]MBK2044482.1 3-phosphoshikimate 1-carboxyvinyltransferase [Allofrancisella guangzhouensis]MBK2046027.1 3-phosphoshikimate 1-carboxyvinyltransferase [Allofrancisella guangzhouensis]
MKDCIPRLKTQVKKQVYLDGSKSLSNRALIIAAVSKGQTRFENLPNSADVLTCVAALKELGCDIEHNQQAKTLVINGCDGAFKNKNAKIFCNESGTLTRFIIPMCAVQENGSKYYVYATKRMMERPIADQLKSLEELGMQVTYHNIGYAMPITIYSNLLNGGHVKIDGKKSSQFASGLLMAAPLMQDVLTLESITDHKQPYLDMTTKVMLEFGVNVEVDNHIYKAKKTNYVSPGRYIVEPDVSTASYFWAFAAITGSAIKVMNVTRQSKQGDIKFLEVLQKIGCTINYHDDGIEVIGNNHLKGIHINMRNFSDTFMTLAAIACFAEGDTYIEGLSHTRGQESDRVAAMAEGLTKLGVYVETTEDSILISPIKSNLKSAEIDSYNDHRIAMSLALLGLMVDKIIITNAEAVNKTCPDYFDRMRSLIN